MRAEWIAAAVVAAVGLYAIVEKIATEAVAVVKMPETQKQLAAAGIEPAGEGTAAFQKYLAAEADYVTKLIATAGIKVE